MQHTATHCSTLQHIAAHCITLQHTNTLQHTATHCNTLQHTYISPALLSLTLHHAVHCTTRHKICMYERIYFCMYVCFVCTHVCIYYTKHCTTQLCVHCILNDSCTLHTERHTDTLTRTRPHTHTHAHSLSHTHTYTHRIRHDKQVVDFDAKHKGLLLPPQYCDQIPYIHTHTHIQSHAHTRTHTLSHTHTHTGFDTTRKLLTLMQSTKARCPRPNTAITIANEICARRAKRRL